MDDSAPLEQLKAMVFSVADMFYIDFEGNLLQLVAGASADVRNLPGDVDNRVLNLQINLDAASCCTQNSPVSLLDVTSGDQFERELNTCLGVL